MNTRVLDGNLRQATEALADSLMQAEPIAAYRQAEARLKADGQALNLLERLSADQAALRTLQARSKVTQADVDQVRRLQTEVQANAVIMEYVQTQQAAVAYLRQVNGQIGELLGVDFASLLGRSGCC